MRRFDYTLLGSTGLLILAGLSTLYSIGLTAGQAILTRQLISLGLGIIFFCLAAFFDYRFWANKSAWFYLISIGLLLVLLISGHNVRGSSRWLHIAGFTIQPSEIVKVAIVLGLARFFARRRGEIKDLKVLLHSGVFVGISAILVLIQPDLGSSLVLFGIWFGLLFMAPVKKAHIALLLVMLTIGGIVAWYGVLHDYQKTRIETFLDPNLDPQGSGYNVRQSMIAVGSGQFLGRGLGKGYQSHLSFLPERHTDFIFASFAEELGFLGSFALIVLFGVVIWRIVRIARLSTNALGSYLAMGVALLIMIQVFINVGMNIGLMPVTGIPLPLLSYGGSSLMSTLFLLGLVQSVYRLNQARL